MNKRIVFLLISLSIILTGCATQYIEPVDGPKARLRIIPQNLEGEDIRRFGPKAITAVTITRNSCIRELSDNYVFVAYGKKGRVLDGLKNQPVSIGMPGEYKQHMYEVYIPAKQDISVGYHYLFKLTLGDCLIAR